MAVMDSSHIFPYFYAALAVVEGGLEPAVVEFMSRLWVPLTMPALQKLATIISLKISKLYRERGIEPHQSDTAAAMMAEQAANGVHALINKLRLAIVWSIFDNSRQCSFPTDKTFGDFMDYYFHTVGCRMGAAEFGGMSPPPPGLTQHVLRLLIKNNMKFVEPFGVRDNDMRAWMKQRFTEAASEYVKERKSRQDEYDDLSEEIDRKKSRLQSLLNDSDGDEKDILDEDEVERAEECLRRLKRAWRDYDLTPFPRGTSANWFENMRWHRLRWYSTAQLVEMRTSFGNSGIYNKGIDREIGVRKGKIVGLWWEPNINSPQY